MVTAEGATAGAGVGGTARGGGRRGDVSGGVADADERADEGVALAGGDDDDGGVDERLVMGTRGYLNPLLSRRRKLGGEPPIS